MVEPQFTVDIDQVNHSLYLTLTGAFKEGMRVHRTIEVTPQVQVDIDERGAVLGVEFLDGDIVGLAAELEEARDRCETLTAALHAAELRIARVDPRHERAPGL